MDTRLRILKRLVTEDPNYMPLYIGALERVIGGVAPFEKQTTPSYQIFGESLIADAEMRPNYDVDAVAAVRLSVAGSTVGYMVDVQWSSSYDEDEWPEIWQGLSQDFRQLLSAAEAQGYQYIILWG